MKSRLANTITPQMKALLEENGIDVTRCTDATVHHSPGGAVTEITVTLLALAPPAPDGT